MTRYKATGRYASPIVRVERRCIYVDRGYATPCLIYQGYLHQAGYGMLSVDGRPARAHRVTYEHYIGPIPEGLEIDHLCRQRDCCEVTHLEAVTRAVNQRRGHGTAGINARKTHCKHGHEFNAENTRIFTRPSSGHVYRLCLPCRRARDRIRGAKRRALKRA